MTTSFKGSSSDPSQDRLKNVGKERAETSQRGRAGQTLRLTLDAEDAGGGRRPQDGAVQQGVGGGASDASVVMVGRGDEGQRGRQGQQLILILVDERETSKQPPINV